MALPAFNAATAVDMRRSMGRFVTGVAVVSTGTSQDTLRTEIPERWLEAAT